MKVIPAIDIIGGKTVRLEQGDYARNLSYDVDPVAAAKEWEKAGAELIHVVDLEGARHGKPKNLAVIQKIAGAVKIPVEAGGGFREYKDIENALNKGIWRVVIGSRAIEEKEFAEKCLAKFGEKVILSVDAKGSSPRTRGWEKVTTADIFEVMNRFVSYGAKELIYTEITRDGMLGGPAIENLETVLDRVKVKIIAAGGIGDIEHIRQLKKLETRGVTGVILGRALYEGAVDLREAIRVGKENNTVS